MLGDATLVPMAPMETEYKQPPNVGQLTFMTCSGTSE